MCVNALARRVYIRSCAFMRACMLCVRACGRNIGTLIRRQTDH